MRNFKKIISFTLCLVMLACVMLPAATAAAAQPTPIIYVRGNGTSLYNADGEIIADEIGDVSFGDEGLTQDKIVETTANILLPFLTEGLIFDKWDNYARAIYDEFHMLMDEATLDGDGNPRYGTGISAAEAAENLSRPMYDYISADGTYRFDAYMFHYDWRLDPYYTADLLHTYITQILKTTGKSQVSLVSRCMGGCVLNAYMERYGSQGHIKNALYGDTLGMGCSVISEGFSGKIKFDPENIHRYAGQLDYCGKMGLGVGFEIPVLADNIINRTLDLFNQVGATDMMLEPVESLYNRLYKALIPALFHAFGMTSMPMYWALVTEEDFNAAFEIMFGDEDSETYMQYEGLIEKILYYREHVTAKLPNLLKTFNKEYGIHIGSVAKYGYLNAPIIESSGEPSDALAQLSHATLGATTAKVGTQLSDSYIEAKIAEGKGEYISPDKQLDLSTSMFPDTAWVVKNQHHDYADIVFGVAQIFCNGTNVTTDNCAYPRFMVYDESTGVWEKMTEDNCVELEFMTRPETEPTRETRLAALIRFFTSIFDFLARLFRGEINLFSK